MATTNRVSQTLKKQQSSRGITAERPLHLIFSKRQRIGFSRSQGGGFKAIARRHRVHKVTVSQIYHGEGWTRFGWRTDRQAAISASIDSLIGERLLPEGVHALRAKSSKSRPAASSQDDLMAEKTVI